MVTPISMRLFLKGVFESFLCKFPAMYVNIKKIYPKKYKLKTPLTSMKHLLDIVT